MLSIPLVVALSALFALLVREARSARAARREVDGLHRRIEQLRASPLEIPTAESVEWRREVARVLRDRARRHAREAVHWRIARDMLDLADAVERGGGVRA